MARNRVEITGINTSELIPITNERMMEILPLAQEGNEDASSWKLKTCFKCC